MDKQFGLSPEVQREIAEALYAAERDISPIDLLTVSHPEITLDDAYAIQKIGTELKIERDGAKIVGRKIGITSRGMMRMLHCDTPDYGCLYQHYQIPEGGSVRRSDFCLPIVEGELAFIMGEDLDKAAVTTADIINATSYVLPCFELCDSRYPTLEGVTVRDTISDNAAARGFVLGSAPRYLTEIDPRNIGMYIEKNGELLGSAAGVEVMGSPVVSVAWLANKLREYGDYLKKGDIVLSGAFMAADHPLAGDIYCMHLDGFDSIGLRFE